MGWWDRPPSSLARQAVGISCNTRDAKLRIETVTFGQLLAGVNFISEFHKILIKNLPTKNFGNAAMRNAKLTRNDARADSHGGHFDDLVANVIWKRATIDEDTAKLVDPTLAGIDES
mgnify:CR=1 FL=1